MTDFPPNPVPGADLGYAFVTAVGLSANYESGEAYLLYAGWDYECDYANIGGMGDRSALITVTANFAPITGTLDNLVDGAATNDAAAAMKFLSGDQDAMIIFDFGVGNEKEVCELRFRQQSNVTHGYHRFFGSNDLLTWALLGGPVELNAATQLVSLQHKGGFRYFVDIQWENVTSLAPWIYEYEFQLRPRAIAASPYVPSYDNKGGRGPRTGIIVATTTYLLSQGAAPIMLKSCIYTLGTDFICRPSASQTSGNFKWDFGEPKVITEATLYCAIGLDHGNHQWAGSNDDVTYTPIGSSFHLLCGEITVLPGLSANVTPYRYYRLAIVSGELDNSEDLWQEIEFKMAAVAP